MLKTLAPVVLFVYNRPDHTRLTVEALKRNTLASESELIIYSDAAKNEESRKSVEEVRAFLKTVNGFKTVTILERERNLGLADSIIDGVSKIVKRYGKIIVLEDDLVTSPYFLTFMNSGLEFYEDQKKVWHISGWNIPMAFDTTDEAFLWRGMNCWGWATWADRWQHYRKDTDTIIKEFTKDDIRRFTIDKTVPNFWEQVIANKTGQINTWAIYWYATIFRQNGLCLNPVVSYVKNIGLDGSGVHGDVGINDNSELNMREIDAFPSHIAENEHALEKIKYYYRKQLIPFYAKVINRISRILLGKSLVK